MDLVIGFFSFFYDRVCLYNPDCLHTHNSSVFASLDYKQGSSTQASFSLKNQIKPTTTKNPNTLKSLYVWSKDLFFNSTNIINILRHLSTTFKPQLMTGYTRLSSSHHLKKARTGLARRFGCHQELKLSSFPMTYIVEGKVRLP